MHNSYVRPGGIWNSGIPVLHGELTQIDQSLFGCISGDTGGTWAPSSVINIGGSGLTVSGVFQATSNTFFTGGFMTVSSVATFGGTNFNVLGIAEFDGSVSCTAGLQVNGNTLLTGNLNVSGQTATGSLVVSTTTTCTGAITCSSLTASGAVQTNGSLTTVGNLNVANGSTFTAGAQVYSGNARPVRAPVFGPASGNFIANPAGGSVYLLASGMSSQNCTLGTTGVQDGDELRITMLGQASAVTLSVLGALSGTLAMHNFSGGDKWSALFKYSSILVGWVLIDAATL